MIYGYFTMLVALTISAIAEYYSIIGLTAIFSAAFWPIVIMGASLGVGKLTAAIWLKMNWERASWVYKFYLVPAVAVLMLLTSIGCFGYLSKAHSDQSLVSGDSMARVAIYDEKIKISKDNIDANRKVLKQYDEAVDQVMGRSTDEKGADKAVSIRRSQQKERARLQAEIETEQKKISQLNEDRAPLAAENRKIESEVGPIKYIAALIYGDNPDNTILEKAVRLVIIIIVLVFDPLALVLILAAQQSIRWAREDKRSPVDEQVAAVPAAPEVAEPIVQKDPDEPQTTVDLFAYLKAPFVHFKNLIPMPAPSNKTIMDDVAAMSIVPPEENKDITIRPFAPEEIVALDNTPQYAPDDGPLTKEQIEQIEETVKQDYPNIKPNEWDGPMKEVIEEHIDPNTRIKTLNHTWVPDLSAHADDVSGTQAHADFGSEFPPNPKKTDMYLRVDYLPAKLFKFNGTKWIEVDKDTTDSYAFNEEYVKYLIDRINSGEYSIDDLSDTEQDQIREYLSNK